MMARRLLAGLLTLSLICGLGVMADSTATAQEKDKKKEKSPLEGKKGTVIGTLTAKGTNFIELTGDGEEKGRKYIPQWVGGAPAKGGGPDKKMVKVISELTIGSRIEIDWLFNEHWRVMSVKVLKRAEKDKN
ncbi:MAG: hypothetical protein EXR98_21765 [Gemmataceae bacterium]|nr:hypothetical protein [Gemmataceae bacterium]